MDFLSAMNFSGYLSGSDLEQSPYSVGNGFFISNKFFWSPSGFLPVLAYGPLEEVKIKTVQFQD